MSITFLAAINSVDFRIPFPGSLRRGRLQPALLSNGAFNGSGSNTDTMMSLELFVQKLFQVHSINPIQQHYPSSTQ